MADFDLLIIGSGVAGRTAADEAVAAGMRVAIAERREFGGTCPLRGCEPKKLMFAVAETVARARDARTLGASGHLTLDWGALQAFKRTMTDTEPERLAAYYRDAGVTLLHGDARFVSAGEVRVGEVTHRAANVLVATGAAPAPLGVPGEGLIIDSETFMALESLPGRVVFLGGGYISFEFAAMAAVTGAEVTIVHRGATPLRGFDPDVVAMLVSQYEASGIPVRLNAAVAEVRRDGDALAVVLADGDELSCDLVVHGAGRVPNLAGLCLEAAGVTCHGHGVAVDDAMRNPGNARVFAAGDAAACGLPLTPVGVAQARVAVRAMNGDGYARFDPSATPSVCFSYPPLAAVGLTERDAADAGLDATAKLTDTSAWWSSKRVGLDHTGAKIVVERATGRILGATLLGHGAEEVVNIFALAIDQGLTADELRRPLWGYPTASSEIVYLL